jgi:predicted nucleic acid-binding protein
VRGEAFLDTAYALALAAPTDQLHAAAVALAEHLEAAGTRLVTTQAILLEIGNALSKRRRRAAAIRLLGALTLDPNVEIVPLTPELFDQGLALFQARPDKDWGLIDCVSFIVMQGRGITEALTSDEHFEQAGFQILLRKS